MKTKLALTLLSAFSLLPSALFAQGSLTPPGAPAPMMKTLDQIEPRVAINATNTPGDADSLFKITQPGSYYLTGNITGVVGKHGVEIIASGVTLDLNGFDLAGVAAMGAFDGVRVTVASLTNIAVVNGSVRNWGDEGVDLGTFTATNCRVADVLASGNAGTGILVSIISTVSNCAVYQNTANGIITSSGSTVSNCSAKSNTGTGISTSIGSTVTNCSAYQNTSNGIGTGSGCTVSTCSAYQNSINGISTATSCTISNCSASFNLSSGINIGSGCTVADCTARGNALDGIVCAGDCVIRGNTCASSGNGGDGAGIHTTGTDTRIEGNNCTGADRGIDVDAAGNIIIRNTCSGNTTDWDIAANNVFGPIIDRRAPASAAVSGFTATSTLGSTDSNANFSY